MVWGCAQAALQQHRIVKYFMKAQITVRLITISFLHIKATAKTVFAESF